VGEHRREQVPPLITVAPDHEVRCIRVDEIGQWDINRGNVPDADVERTVRALPSLCAPGATVIWTRHRGAPDLTPAIRGWFAESGFAEQAFVAPDDVLFSVGTHVLTGTPAPFTPGVRLFAFDREFAGG